MWPKEVNDIHILWLFKEQSESHQNYVMARWKNNNQEAKNILVIKEQSHLIIMSKYDVSS